jgi:hypothetical protein
LQDEVSGLKVTLGQAGVGEQESKGTLPPLFKRLRMFAPTLDRRSNPASTYKQQHVLNVGGQQ